MNIMLTFKRFHLIGMASLLLCAQLHAGIIVDTVVNGLKGAPQALATIAKKIHQGVACIGDDSAIEGYARIGATWVVLNGLTYYYDYMRSDAPLHTIQQQLCETASEKINMGMVKEALREQNKSKLRLALGRLTNIQEEIERLEKFKQQLAPYVTIGGFIGVPEEINIPLIKLHPNRFLATLERIYKYKVKDTSLQSAYALQERVNNLTLPQLEQMEAAVGRHLARWGRIWAFVLIKPTYSFASEMYWNCMAKISYLRKCDMLLGSSNNQASVTVFNVH